MQYFSKYVIDFMITMLDDVKDEIQLSILSKFRCSWALDSKVIDAIKTL